MYVWKNGFQSLINFPNFDLKPLNIVLPTFYLNMFQKSDVTLRRPVTFKYSWYMDTVFDCLNGKPRCTLIPRDLSSLPLFTMQPPSQLPPPTKSHAGLHFCDFAYIFTYSYLTISSFPPFKISVLHSPIQILFPSWRLLALQRIQIFPFSELLLYLQLRKSQALTWKKRMHLKYGLYSRVILIN